MAENIQVFVRCRPLKGDEKQSNMDVDEDKDEVRIDSLGKKFQFSQVFSHEAPQEEIFNAVVQPLIDKVLQGFNSTVFAYGQTGTGKTYTMEGVRSPDRSSSGDERGMIPRAVSQLFKQLKERDSDFTIHVSFLEIYSEDVYDLLTSPDDTTKLKIFDDAQKKGSVLIDGLKNFNLENEVDVLNVLEQGAAKRQTAATLINACSSRSHSIFTITVHQGPVEGKLNLVDLAGSENIARSGASDKHAREAGNINQSLLTLTRVITALVEKRPHVPYRESKLTRILQDSLGGSTRTCMIATISPAEVDQGNTVGTLDYASRARSIVNRPELNKTLIQKKSGDLSREIEELKEKHASELAEIRFRLRSEIEFKIRNEVALEFRREMEKNKESIKEQYQGKIEALEQRLSQQNEKLNDQEAREKTLQDLVTTLQISLKESDRQRVEFKIKAEDLERTIEELERRHRSNINELTEKLDQQRIELEQLQEQENLHRQQQQQQLVNVHESTPPIDNDDYANMTLDGDDEIVQVSTKKPRRTLASKKREPYQPAPRSGKKTKIERPRLNVDYEVSPRSPPARVTRSRATKRKLDF